MPIPKAGLATVGVVSIGGLTVGAYTYAILGIEKLNGNPSAARKIAELLDKLADEVEDSLVRAGDPAEEVWRHNVAKEVTEFKTFYRDRFEHSAAQVPADCRRAAAALRQYAEVIETVNHYLDVLTAVLIIEMLYTIGYQYATWRIIQKIFQAKAFAAKKAAKRWVLLLIEFPAYWVVDSLAYPLHQFTRWATFKIGGVEKDAEGNSVLSASHNFKEYWRHFVSNVAFDSVADGAAQGAKRIPGLRRMSDLPLNFGSFAPRMMASYTYSIVYNATDGEWTEFTSDQFLNKLVTHGLRSFIPKPGWLHDPTATSGAAGAAGHPPPSGHPPPPGGATPHIPPPPSYPPHVPPQPIGPAPQAPSGSVPQAPSGPAPQAPSGSPPAAAQANAPTAPNPHIPGGPGPAAQPNSQAVPDPHAPPGPSSPQPAKQPDPNTPNRQEQE